MQMLSSVFCKRQGHCKSRFKSAARRRATTSASSLYRICLLYTSVANSAINLELHEGEILSLLGENGSGKTTLMNMLSGIYFPDEGQIYIHGEPVTIASPKDAFEHGIGMIHQHFKLVDLFTATENIVLGLEGKLDLAEASKKDVYKRQPDSSEGIST